MKDKRGKPTKHNRRKHGDKKKEVTEAPEKVDDEKDSEGDDDECHPKCHWECEEPCKPHEYNSTYFIISYANSNLYSM